MEKNNVAVFTAEELREVEDGFVNITKSVNLLREVEELEDNLQNPSLRWKRAVAQASRRASQSFASRLIDGAKGLAANAVCHFAS